LQRPLTLAIDSSAVYWAEVFTETISSYSLAGAAAPDKLARTSFCPRGVWATDDGWIYWLQDGAVMAKERRGNPFVLVDLPPGSCGSPYRALVAGQDHLYFYYGSDLHRASRVGGVDEVIRAGSMWSLTRSDSHVYWVEYDVRRYHRILRLSLRGAPAIESWEGSMDNIWNIAVHDGYVYWFVGSSTIDATMLFRRHENGAAIEELSIPYSTNWSDMAIDGSGIYGADGFSRRIQRRDHATGVVDTLATGQVSPDYIALDPHNVYWLTKSRLMRLVK
jgi:hypothetical protein